MSIKPNHINKIREEIKQYFNSELIIENSNGTSISPNNNYRIETVEYKQDKADVSWIVTKVEIFDNASNERLFSFFCNDQFFHSWQIKENSEYLICAEDIFGGQTVIDLTNRQMASYSPDEDGFIWTKHFLSPGKNILAVEGCYWAAPFVVKFYRFDSPLDLPLKEIQELELIESSDNFIEWVNNKTVKLKDDNGKERLVKIENF